MGISKKASEEVFKSAETSSETLKPIKEALLKMAVSKDLDGLKKSPVDVVLEAVVKDFTSRALKELVETKTLRSASSAKLRNLQTDLNNCFSTQGYYSLPDRTLRETVTENWKDYEGIFPRLDGGVSTFGGQRTSRTGCAFSMLVENTAAVRRYVRYVNKKLPRNAVLAYTPIPLSVKSVEKRLLHHSPVPKTSRNQNQLGGFDYITLFNDSEYSLVYTSYCEEVVYLLVHWWELSHTRSYYHSSHSWSTLLEVAKHRTLQSLLGDFRYLNRVNNSDIQLSLTNRAAELRRVFKLNSNLPVPERTTNALYMACHSLSSDFADLLQPLFQEMWPLLSKQSPTAADKASVPTFDLCKELLEYPSFLQVSLEYVNQRAYRDKTGKQVFSAKNTLESSGFPSVNSAFVGILGVDLVAYTERSRQGPFMSTLGTQLASERSAMEDTTLRAEVLHWVVPSVSQVVTPVKQVATIFDTLQRKNLWTTLLKS